MVAWIHSDSRGLGNAIPVALAASVAGRLGATEEEIARNLRAQLVAAVVCVDALSTVPSTSDGTLTKLGERSAAQFASPERAQMAGALLAWCAPLYWQIARSAEMPNRPGGPPLAPIVNTSDGAPALHTLPAGMDPANAAFAWPAAAAVIVGTVGAVVLGCYIADKVSEVSVRGNVAMADAQVAIGKAAALAQATAAHVTAEQASGHAIPLNDAERALIADVQRSTEVWANRVQSELPSIFPNFKPTGGEIVKATQGSINFALVLGALVLVFMLSRK